MIQYPMGKPSGQNNVNCPYLGDIDVDKKDRTCRGVKMCEFARSELQEVMHDSVDPDSDLHLKINGNSLTNTVESETFA
jgi:hypothetical protein